jgi:NADPH:quinone reductase
MQAIVHDPAAPEGLRHAEVPEPVPTPDQALVAVQAASVNFIDAAYGDRLAAGAVADVDAAGVVVAAAADGSGPATGTHVVGFGPGTWAERAVLRATDLAAVPKGMDLSMAAALPGAGVTALQALRRLGFTLGRRLLVTGASGGVGRYAVQLAALAGADVIAHVGSPDRSAGLEALGASEVVTSLTEVPPLHGVLDNVGGSLLAQAFALLVEDGRAVSIGQASRQPTTIDLEVERQRLVDGRQIDLFVIGGPVGADLEVLLELTERGKLDPHVSWRSSWRRAGEAVTALLERRVVGKAVLEIA